MSLRSVELLALLIFLLVVGLAAHTWLLSHDEQQRLQSTLAAQKQLLDAADSRQRSRDAALSNTLAEIEKLKATTQTSQQLVAELQNYLSLPQPIALVDQGLSLSKTIKKSPSLTRSATQPSQASDAQKPSATGQPEPDASAPVARESSLLTGLNPPPSASATDHPAPASPDSRLPTGQLPGSAPIPIPQSVRPGNPCPTSSDCAAEIPAADLKPLYNYVQDCRSCGAQLAVAKQNASDDAAKIAALTRERDAAIAASKGGSFWRRLRHDALILSVGAVIGYAATR